MARYSRIHLGPARRNDPQVHEAEAAVAIAPGSAVAINASGQFDLATAATTSRVFLAQENYLAMKGVAVPYDAGDRVLGLHLQDDTHYAAIIPTGVNVSSPGAALALGAGGKLALATEGDRVVAYADEAFNNTTGSDQLIRVRVAA